MTVQKKCSREWEVCQIERSFPQGLKRWLILVHLTYELKPAPFNMTHYLGVGFGRERERVCTGNTVGQTDRNYNTSPRRRMPSRISRSLRRE